MKELTKKILESGLVDEHVARMMERWGQLDDGASDLVGRKKVTKQTLVEFAEEIDTLVENGLVDLRETRLDIDAKVVTSVSFPSSSVLFKAYIDSLGRVIFPVNPGLKKLQPGSEFLICTGKKVGEDGEESVWVLCTVLDTEYLFHGDLLTALQVTVDKQLP